MGLPPVSSRQRPNRLAPVEQVGDSPRAQHRGGLSQQQEPTPFDSVLQRDGDTTMGRSN
jgi:hypothetical protein